MTDSRKRAERLSAIARPHRFCWSCGAALQIVAAPSRLALPLCKDCGHGLPSGPVPAVGVALLRGDRVLLVRRRYAPMVGSWAIPGGFMEGRETPERTARREIAEETGLEVRLTGMLGVFRGGGSQGRVLFLCYRGEVEGGRLRAGDDASDVGFFSITKLPRPMALGPHPKVVEMLRQERKTRGR